MGQDGLYELLLASFMPCSGQDGLFEPLQASYTFLQWLKRTLRASKYLIHALRWSKPTFRPVGASYTFCGGENGLS